ncbi:MAG: FG-GAP-like repeat-containing protein [Bacteroidetes bacterium]|nr:FG-GAP-like repeat-containing protein [Bacteroidota bacterium]MCL1968350.1 FG-GAP-like repeat-containing protein [Bacteroidota bacterium]
MKNNLHCTLIILFLHTIFVNMLNAQNTTLPVGAIPGAIDVSPMGAATYTIPIEVVPGTQGVQPNLSIVYNSFSGMGILGMKWSLAGLSAIFRCGQIPYYDGDMTAIQFNDNDRFALDGTRLLMQNNGTYGAVSAQYATEIENFMRIVSYSGTDGTPDYFTAFTDDGGIIEYGNTTGNTSNSKQKMTDPTKILSWMVNKITDANGNYMVFNYEQSNGDIRINNIQYTGNGNMATYAKVEFTYVDSLTDRGKNTCFVGGYGILQSKLLKTITVKYSNTVVRKYQFNYNTGIAGERTAHLKEVVLYGENNAQLNKTKIDWGAQNTDIDAALTSGLPDLSGGQIKTITGDFNGDGYTDIAVYGIGSYKIYLNDRAGSFIRVTGGDHYPNCKFYVYDLNMDGKDELIIGESSDNQTWKFRIMSFFPNSECVVGPFEDFKEAYFGKFNSSGVPDVLFLCKRQCISLSYPYYWFIYELFDREKNRVYFFNDYDGKFDTVYIADINGNGKDNIQVVINTTANTYEFQSDVLTLVKTDGFPTKWHKVYYGDFNGDGIKDALVFCKPANYDSYKWFLHVGTGNCVFTHPDPPQIIPLDVGRDNNGSAPNKPTFIADINGDGKDEIIQSIYLGAYENKTKLYYYYLNNFSNNGTCNIQRDSITLDNGWYFMKDYYRLGDFNGDGKIDIFLRDSKNNLKVAYAHKNEQYEFAKQITDGMEKIIKLSYHPQYFTAENKQPYDKPPYYHFLYQKYFLPVVDTLQTSNGTGNGFNKWVYDFDFDHEKFPPVFSLSRRIFLGFKKFDCINIQEYKKVTYTFDFMEWTNEKQMLLPSSQSISIKQPPSYQYGTINDRLLIYTAADLPNNRFATYCSKEITKDYLTDTKTQTKITVNNKGRAIKSINLTFDRCNAADNEWKYTDTTAYYYKGISLINTYQKKTVIEKTLTTQRYADSPVSITDTLTYKYAELGADKGRLLWERKGNIDGSVTTSYGNYTQTGAYCLKTVLAGGISRTETLQYDTKQRLITSIANSLGHSATFTCDDKTGNKLREVNANNLTTTYNYDNFGKLTRINYPDGTYTIDTVYWNTSNFPPKARYYTYTVTGKHTLYVYYDILGREVCRYEDGYYTDTRYYMNGQVEKTSYPYVSPSTQDNNKIWHIYTYDNFGRIKTEQAPYTNLQYNYNKRKVTVNDRLRSVSSYKDYDVLGRMIEANDAGGTITYTYTIFNDANNKKRHQTTIQANGATTTIISDLWGNRISIQEPNAGLITSTYNKFNELIKQIDARNDTTSYQYDVLGRVTQKRFAAPNTAPLTYIYTYDTYTSTNRGKGKLSQITVNGKPEETYTYDALGRMAQHTKTIDAAPYAHSYTYDADGELQTLTYPDGFSVKYGYSSSNGKLKTIRRNDNSNALIYEVKNRNQFGTLRGGYGNNLETEYKYNEYGLLTGIKTGSKVINPQDTAVVVIVTKGIHKDSLIMNYNYAYNNRGVMTARADSVLNYSEEFTYDYLDRLTGFTSGKIGQQGTLQTFSYSNNGNISATSQLGSYAYGGKPHAVVQIANPTGVISNNPCAVSYNFFNQPTEITEGDYKLELFYGANQQRNKALTYRNNVLKNTHYYINKYYEKEIDSANVTRHYHYIYGDNGVVAMHIASPGKDSMYYIHTDHLGNYAAITNSAKIVRQQNWFDPWGNYPIRYDTIPRKGLSPLIIENYALNFPLTFRGFTGHEHYPQFKIINMNGRLYDPVIARFFSPDKFVANSSFTQDFNRYTYARNNPLMYTDPSGEFVWFAPLIAIAISAAIAATTYTVNVAVSQGGFQNWDWGQFAFSAMFGAVTGAFSLGVGEALAAPLTAAGIGGFWAGLISGATSGAVAGTMNGLVQASITGATGKDFWRTLGISAGMGAGMGGLIGGISGGIQAKMNGRTFWNGNIRENVSFAQPAALAGVQGEGKCFTNTMKSLSDSFNEGYELAEIHECGVWADEANHAWAYADPSVENYAEWAGRELRVMNYPSKNDFMEAFQRGDRIAMSTYQYNEYNEPVPGHFTRPYEASAIKLTRVNGTVVYRHISSQIYNPSPNVSGNVQTYRWWQLRSSKMYFIW